MQTRAGSGRPNAPPLPRGLDNRGRAIERPEADPQTGPQHHGNHPVRPHISVKVHRTTSPMSRRTTAKLNTRRRIKVILRRRTKVILRRRTKVILRRRTKLILNTRRTATTTDNIPADNARDNEVEAGTSQSDGIPQATTRKLQDSDSDTELKADPRGSRRGRTRGRARLSDSEGSRSSSRKRCKRTKRRTSYDPTPAGVPRSAPELPEMMSQAQVPSHNENHPNQLGQLTLEDLSGLHSWE